MKYFTTSVRSGNTLLNQLTVKPLSPLWDKAVDEQVVHGLDSSYQTWNLFVYQEAYLQPTVSPTVAQKEAQWLPQWENPAAIFTPYDSTLWQTEHAHDNQGQFMKF